MSQTADQSLCAPYPFAVRGMARCFRYSRIIGALGALEPGVAMRFINDHDPLPQLDQTRERFGEQADTIYCQRDPGAIGIDFVTVA